MMTGQRLVVTCPPVGLTVESEADMGPVRHLAAAASHAQGFDQTDGRRVSRVATEMAKNLAANTGSTRMFVQLIERADLRGVGLVAMAGPQFDDTSRWHTNRDSTAGAAVGLAAIAHLADEFDAYSEVGQGAAMMARLWGGRLNTGPADRFLVGAMAEAIPSEVVSGDAWAVEQDGTRVVLLVADGLGHGVEAAAASAAAVEAFRLQHQGSVEDIANHIHRALHATRGAAIAVAEVDPESGRVRFCGIGNIFGRLIGAGRDRQLVSMFGIAGYQAAQIRAFEVPWESGALLVMHSDGLSAKWDFAAYPDLRRHHPQLAAATVMRDAPRADDDALVLALCSADDVPSKLPGEA